MSVVEELRAELDKFQEKALLKSSLAWDTFDTLKESVLSRVQKLLNELAKWHKMAEKNAPYWVQRKEIVELEGRFAEILNLAKELSEILDSEAVWLEMPMTRKVVNWSFKLDKALKKEGLVGET